MWRKRSASATYCIFEPGSVMATKLRRPASAGRPPPSRARRSTRLKMFGSSVLPDLLETMNSVRARSIAFSSARICAGSVESRTRSSGKPGDPAEGRGRAPRGRGSSRPCRAARRARSPPLATSSADCAQVVDVRAAGRRWCRASRASCASSSPVHSVASRAHSRRTLPPSRHSLSAAFDRRGRGRLGQREGLALGRPRVGVRLALRDRGEQLVEGVRRRACTPSARSWSVTCFIEMPTLGQRVHRVACASLEILLEAGAQRGRGRGTRRSVGGGIVLTVSGPISSST